MKILIGLNDIFGYGGVERTVSLTANYFINKLNYDIEIINFFNKNNELNFDLSSKINIYNLKGNNYHNKIKKYYYKFKNLEKIILNNDYDVVLGCSVVINLLFYLVKLKNMFKLEKLNILAWEHSQYSNINKKLKIIRRILYPKLEGVITLTQKDKEKFSNFCNNTKVIHNINPYIDNTRRSKLKNNRIIAVGRLEKEKSFDKLIKSFNLINNKNENWELDIFGKGREISKLKKLINNLDLKDKVNLKGFSNNIEKEYLKSSIFVLSSQTESFGMVIVEAMSFGIPCVSFDCETGPREIITDGVDGYLVELNNIEELSKKILVLINNYELRREMGKAAFKKSKLFSKKSILNKWKYYLEKISE